MPKIVIVNNAEAGITEFAEPIEKIISESGASSVFIEYNDCLNFNFDEFDGAILTGSPQGDDIVALHLPYFHWIQSFENPVLGICAGHHITGYMFGSTLLRNQEPEAGDFDVEIVKDDFIFNGMPGTFKVKQMHNDSITVPNGFQLLATSKNCRNQIMKQNEKPLYSCQFHPELYNHNFIRNFIRMCM